jgi:hypothetical protein
MSSQTIRLRLIIRRHSVPEVKLVWPCVATEDLTVSKLLALVNEVVPLESGDWGLEDYVIELPDEKGDSFELLHFQPVGKVLKQDDQVLYDLQHPQTLLHADCCTELDHFPPTI